MENIFELAFLNSNVIFWVCAITGTTLFVIQLMICLLGFTDYGDFEDISDFKWLSKQAVTGFLMMFGWSGITCHEEFHLNDAYTLIISILIGTLTILITGYIFKLAGKLHSTGNILNLGEAIGKEASVYQSIPEDGVGTVTVTFPHCTLQINAISHDGKEICSFSQVKIINKIDEQTVVVIAVKDLENV